MASYRTKVPIIRGHEIVGRVDAIGTGVEGLHVGERVSIPWLGHTWRECAYCKSDQENLCDQPAFTGYTRDGGFATAAVADARYAFRLGEAGTDEALARSPRRQIRRGGGARPMIQLVSIVDDGPLARRVPASGGGDSANRR